MLTQRFDIGLNLKLEFGRLPVHNQQFMESVSM